MIIENQVILSIIVPVYNVEDYLIDCLESLIHQNIDKSRYEIICINDGSTDDSKTILDKYDNDYENIVVVHQSNKGVSSARNKGIELARGRYLWFVDSDDVISYNSFDDIITVLLDKSPDILFVKPIAFDNNDKVENFKTGKVNEDNTTSDYFDWLWTRLINSRIIQDSGVRFNPRVSIAEDHLFCTMLNPYIKMVNYYDKVVYGYRRRTNSLSSIPSEKKMVLLINSSKEFLESAKNGLIDYDIAMKEVYLLMSSVMSAIAKMPNKKAKPIIFNLKQNKLFPLKKPKNNMKSDSTSSNMKLKKIDKLKFSSFTLFGYNRLRVYHLCKKIKRRVYGKK